MSDFHFGCALGFVVGVAIGAGGAIAAAVIGLWHFFRHTNGRRITVEQEPNRQDGQEPRVHPEG